MTDKDKNTTEQKVYYLHAFPMQTFLDHYNRPDETAMEQLTTDEEH